MKGILLAILFMAAATGTFAQRRTTNINQHQHHQQHRIRQGLNNGTLTPREAGHLQTRQARIQQNKLRAKSDGKVTMQERARLNRQQKLASRAIYHQKHDLQVAR
jgi:hypothetical protein